MRPVRFHCWNSAAVVVRPRDAVQFRAGRCPCFGSLGDVVRPHALFGGRLGAWLTVVRDHPETRHRPSLAGSFAGVRIGEALAVSWDEVDLDQSTVDIQWKIIRVRGKGLLRLPRPKSESGERTLPLPSFAVAMLRRRMLSKGDALPIFPDSQGGWRDPSDTRRDLRTARGNG